ncbi:AAA family ATPase [Tenacibaculum agarivorans]|uniref:AAA family ATPase n=1 Tax=Tenacibaculum agarivorans TaxID=1908389 RepID=UPI00094BC49A|nr:AAA family ATPase [Tenacibaculum agarivorans]
MLKKIELSNYKAFENVEIPIKPITILLGANSVGKSSIIQSLLMFQQTGKEDLKSYKSALKLYGGYVNLGDPRNLFRKKNTEKDLTFSFEIRSSALKEFCREEILDEFKRIFSEIPFYLPLRGFSEIRNNLEINNEKDFVSIVDSIINILSKESSKPKIIDEIEFFLKNRYSIKINKLSRNNKNEIIEIYKFLESLRKSVKTESFKINYKLSMDDNNFTVNTFEILQKEKLIIGFYKKEDLFSLDSQIFQLSQSNNDDIKRIFDGDSTIFNCFRSFFYKEDVPAKLNVIAHILTKFQAELRNEFSEKKINYVSPLRAHPKRYYMLDKAKLNLTLNTLDGDAIAEVLKENKALTKKVNSWLSAFGIEVDVKEFREVIHQLIVKQNNLDLDITDVGFGISQILPVIIQGFLSRRDSITIVEQPEIHLHPKIQADLADLFIDIIGISAQRSLIIETHSEYLLKRLRRRISEGKINPEKVAICLFNPQLKGDGAKVEILKIEEKGYFEWPNEFYGGELMKDTTEFLKNQR